jgi:subtilisin family serine protease
MIEALEWVREQNRSGAHHFTVVNMSIGDRPDGWPDLWDPLNKAIEEASREGITVVAAAGNRGPSPRTIGSPGDAPSAITVGSVSREGELSEFSSRGPTDSNNDKPDVLAPGERIPSWNAQGSTLDRFSDTIEELRGLQPEALKQRVQDDPDLVGRFGLPHDDVAKLTAEQVAERFKPALPPSRQPFPDVLITSGTSMATPLIAGTVAVLQQAYPGLTALEAKTCLGRGLVDAERALGMAQSA